MINIVTKLNNKDAFLIDLDVYFNLNIPFKVLSKDKDYLDVIKKIDTAEFIADEVIKTRFGITVLSNLSTGCKVVLSYLYLKKSGVSDIKINITECGGNALEVLFSYADKFADSNTVFYLGHGSGLDDIRNRDYYINGKHYNVLWEGIYENL